MLPDEEKALLSPDGESRISSILSPEWGLQQQVYVCNKILSCVTLLLVQIRAWSGCNKMQKNALPCLILTWESVHTVNKEVRTTRRRKLIISHRQDIVNQLFSVCSDWGKKKNVSSNRRQTVLLLTRHMPQKWNFSFWKRTCHSSFLSPWLWCHCECLYMPVCCRVNQGWLRLN